MAWAYFDKVKSEWSDMTSLVERVLKKHTQLKVPVPSKNYMSKSKRVAYLKVLMSIE